jgi:hypothetical protein
MIAGTLVAGDWQPKYSRYKNKIIQVDQVEMEYTPQELSRIKAEFNGRLTPTGRKRKQL